MRPCAPNSGLAIRFPVVFLAFSATIFGLPAAGDTPRNAVDAPFFERVDVDVINVEAFVTDKKGNPIADLTAADFEILEDGQPVEITNFFHPDRLALTGGGPVLGSPAEPAPSEPTAGDAAPPSLLSAPPAVAPAQQLNLLVYVDLYNLRPTNKARVMQQLGGFLEERSDRGDRIMMVAHDRSVVLIHPFTQDRKEIEAGLRKVEGMATNGQIMDAERRRVFRSMFFTTGETGMDMKTAFDNIRTFVRQQSMETEMSMAALRQVVRSLGGLPGRRALLYVSDGLEQQPAADLFQTFREMYARNNPTANRAEEQPEIERARGDLSRLFQEVAAAANTYQVTLYTLQARGAAGIGSVSAEESGDAGGLGGRINANVAREQSEQEPLLTMAEQTGGSAIINTSNFSGMLAELAKDFDHPYSLGYRTRGKGDGKYHKIEVKVKRPGLEVRHRQGFVDAPESERAADRAYSALFAGSEKNPLEVTVDFATPQPESAGKYHLPLLIKIPLRQVTLLPDGDQRRGKLRIYFAVLDPDGAISQVQEIPYPVALPAAQADQLQDKEIGYAVKLAVRSGSPKVAISVWDEVSGSESNLLRTVRVGGVAVAKTSR